MLTVLAAAVSMASLAFAAGASAAPGPTPGASYPTGFESSEGFQPGPGVANPAIP
jgi:hypothetical protein